MTVKRAIEILQGVDPHTELCIVEEFADNKMSLITIEMIIQVHDNYIDDHGDLQTGNIVVIF